jgi:hypothetical protein
MFWFPFRSQRRKDLRLALAESTRRWELRIANHTRGHHGRFYLEPVVPSQICIYCVYSSRPGGTGDLALADAFIDVYPGADYSELKAPGSARNMRM